MISDNLRGRATGAADRFQGRRSEDEILKNLEEWQNEGRAIVFAVRWLDDDRTESVWC